MATKLFFVILIAALALVNSTPVKSGQQVVQKRDSFDREFGVNIDVANTNVPARQGRSNDDCPHC
ncbi:hypothetical protein DL96DRAFT_1818907 [Flagelloscypha sp. PMI_526]|nr:hypothetical protein DL96DRAFT_1818907 [Flagelloscypha sp. PMI_526]